MKYYLSAYFIFTLLLVACSKESDEEVLKFAVTDVEGREELLTNFEDFKEELEESIDIKLEFFAVPDRTAAVTALESNQVDILLSGPAEYVIIKERNDVIPIIGIPQPDYHSIIVVKKDSQVKKVEDLIGTKISMSDLGSTSGHLAPTKLLVDEGLNPSEDVEIIMLGDGHLQAFNNNDVEAWGGGWKHFERFLRSEKLSEDDFRILVKGPELPSDLIVARKGIPEATINNIREGMFNNEEKLVEALANPEGNEKYVNTHFIDVQDSDFDYIREMFDAVGISYTE